MGSSESVDAEMNRFAAPENFVIYSVSKTTMEIASEVNPEVETTAVITEPFLMEDNVTERPVVPLMMFADFLTNTCVVVPSFNCKVIDA